MSTMNSLSVPLGTLSSMGGASGNTTGSIRPPSARPGSALRPSSGVRPQSGVRPGTQNLGRPGTPGGSKLASHVGKRNVINQGLGSMVASTGGPGRTIADKNYYVTELRSRITELNTEIEKMNTEIEQFERDNQASLQLERKIEGLTQETNALQGQLADYNLVLDRLHTSTTDLEVEQFNELVETLRTKNEAEKKRADQIFTERNEKEEQIRETEDLTATLQAEIDQQMRNLDPEQLEKYQDLTQENQSLASEIASLQGILEELTQECSRLEDDLNIDPAKQKSLALHDELHQLQKQKLDLEEELGSTQLSIPEEIERLTQKVKAANAEVANFDQQRSEVLDHINNIREEISKTEKAMADSKSDRAEKFRELIKKDKDMTTFIEKYEATKKEALENNTKLETAIVHSLEAISRLLSREVNLPSAENLQEMKDSLQYKETQIGLSQTTTIRLQEELNQRKLELVKMNNLDTRIGEESATLKQQMDRMRKELTTFGDIESAKREFERQKVAQTEEKNDWGKRRDLLGQENQLLAPETDAKEKLLRDNETHGQLEVLEKSLKHYEQNNHSMKEYIATKGKESDYKAIASEVDNLMEEINKLCVQSLASNAHV